MAEIRPVSEKRYALEFSHAEARDVQNGIWRALHDDRLPECSRPTLTALYRKIRDASGWVSDQDQD